MTKLRAVILEDLLYPGKVAVLPFVMPSEAEGSAVRLDGASVAEGKANYASAAIRNLLPARRIQAPMTEPEKEDIESGASHVEETEQLASGLSDPRQEGHEEIEDLTQETALADLTLSMFTQGASTRVRVGNVHNSSEFYEFSYDSPDEANNAMLDAGILTNEQVPDISQPAGTGILVSGITVEQLMASGLKRHGTSTL